MKKITISWIRVSCIGVMIHFLTLYFLNGEFWEQYVFYKALGDVSFLEENVHFIKYPKLLDLVSIPFFYFLLLISNKLSENRDRDSEMFIFGAGIVIGGIFSILYIILVFFRISTENIRHIDTGIYIISNVTLIFASIFTMIYLDDHYKSKNNIFFLFAGVFVFSGLLISLFGGFYAGIIQTMYMIVIPFMYFCLKRIGFLRFLNIFK